MRLLLASGSACGSFWLRKARASPLLLPSNRNDVDFLVLSAGGLHQ